MKKRFEILEEISRSGLARVCRARDLTLGRPVLLKILDDQLAKDPLIVKRFEREANAGARLHHPNIVVVYDYGPWGNSRYIALEFVEGKSASEQLAESSRMAVSEVAHLARHVLAALAYAHRKGVLHRDIKPGNILLSSDGLVKITDFGLASIEGSTTITEEGGIVGTPAYMSPEQVRGQKLDPRSDIFSLGVTLYELLSGLRVFDGGAVSACLTSILMDRPEPVRAVNPQVPGPLSDMIARSMAPDREARYPHCGAFLKDLEAWISESKILPPAAIHSLPRGGMPIRRSIAQHKRLAVMVSVLMLAAAGGIWSGFHRSGPAAPQETLPGGASVSVELSAQDSGMQSGRALELADELLAKGGHEAAGRYAMVDTTSPEEAAETAANLAHAPSITISSGRGPAFPMPDVEGASLAVRDTGLNVGPASAEIGLSGAHPITNELTQPVIPPGTLNELPPEASDKVSRAPAYLAIHTKPWARVFIDGAYVDTTPLENPLEVPGGTHEVSLLHNGFPAVVETVSVHAGESREVHFRLMDRLGFIRLHVHPWAHVWVDGDSVGTSPFDRPLALGAGLHTLRLYHPNHDTLTHLVQVAPGDTLQVRLNLEGLF